MSVYISSIIWYGLTEDEYRKAYILFFSIQGVFYLVTGVIGISILYILNFGFQEKLHYYQCRVRSYLPILPTAKTLVYVAPQSTENFSLHLNI